jgi:hypothetical protein
LEWPTQREQLPRCKVHSKRGEIAGIDRKIVQEILKSSRNIDYKESVEEIDMQLSTIASQERDLEMAVDTFTETLQSTGRETFKSIRERTRQKGRNQSAGGRTD